jgi:hypothetical protein
MDFVSAELRPGMSMTQTRLAVNADSFKANSFASGVGYR